MCLILFAHRAHPEYPLVLAANRDEFSDRPTAPARFWPEAPELLAGRDLRHGGTWLGLTRSGRIAFVTNYRDPARELGPGSRGELPVAFLRGAEPPGEFLRRLQQEGGTRRSFNLVVGDRSDLWYHSNRHPGVRRLEPGIYGLSNRLLDTPWPKVTRSKEGLARLLTGGEIDEEELFQLLADRIPAAEEQLPETGVGREWERLLSPAFIVAPGYGTRSSTVILADRRGRVRFSERTFPSGPDEYRQVREEFAFS